MQGNGSATAVVTPLETEMNPAPPHPRPPPRHPPPRHGLSIVTPLEALQYLSQQHEVHWIEPNAQMRLYTPHTHTHSLTHSLSLSHTHSLTHIGPLD